MWLGDTRWRRNESSILKLGYFTHLFLQEKDPREWFFFCFFEKEIGEPLLGIGSITNQ